MEFENGKWNLMQSGKPLYLFASQSVHHGPVRVVRVNLTPLASKGPLAAGRVEPVYWCRDPDGIEV